MKLSFDFVNQSHVLLPMVSTLYSFVGIANTELAS